MGRILLLTIFIFSYSLSFSQVSEKRTTNWNDSLFEERKELTELKIYPNPCKTDKVTLEFGSHQIAEYKITNIAGKQVLHKRFNYPEHKKQIQLESIQNGIYLIQVKSTDNKTIVRKLIISKM